MKKIKIIIVEDHKLVREGIKKILSLENDFKVIGEANTGKEAIALVSKLLPDIVLVDINLPDMSGQRVCSEIKALGAGDTASAPCGVKVIMLSMYDDEDNVVQAVRAGASGYVVKSVSSEVLVKSIRLVHSGEVVLPRDLTAKLISAVQKEPSQILTSKEIEILKLVKMGLSNKKIANMMHIADKTVKNHLYSIFQKLGVKNRTEAVVKAIEEKIIL